MGSDSSLQNVYIPPHRRDGPYGVTRRETLVGRDGRSAVRTHFVDDAMASEREIYVSRRNNMELFMLHVDWLDQQEPDQIRGIAGSCPNCSESYYGLLDEGRLSLPLGGLRRYIDRRPSAVYFLRMEVVRSGIWSREQLRGALYTQHELGVCERAYRSIRPRVCGCDFGDPSNYSEADLEALRSAGIDLEFTAPEKAFLAGKVVPTGFRRRSPGAMERRNKRIKRDPIPVEKVPRKVAHKQQLPDANLRRHRPRTDRELRRKAWKQERQRLQFINGPYKEDRYWYFFRTRGKVYLSVHHRKGVGTHKSRYRHGDL